MWENLFWYFGHPEVYLLLLPGTGAMFDYLSNLGHRAPYLKKWMIAAMGAISVDSVMVFPYAHFSIFKVVVPQFHIHIFITIRRCHSSFILAYCFCIFFIYIIHFFTSCYECNSGKHCCKEYKRYKPHYNVRTCCSSAPKELFGILDPYCITDHYCYHTYSK